MCLDGKKPLVLVVDDQALVRWNAVEILEAAGFATLEAGNATEAIETIRERSDDIAIVFTDIEMPPGMDGLGLVAEVHERWPRLLLLVSSGGIEVEEAALPDHGKFLTKPYPGPRLVEKIGQLLTLRENGQA